MLKGSAPWYVFLGWNPTRPYHSALHLWLIAWGGPECCYSCHFFKEFSLTSCRCHQGPRRGSGTCNWCSNLLWGFCNAVGTWWTKSQGAGTKSETIWIVYPANLATNDISFDTVKPARWRSPSASQPKFQKLPRLGDSIAYQMQILCTFYSWYAYVCVCAFVWK